MVDQSQLQGESEEAGSQSPLECWCLQVKALAASRPSQDLLPMSCSSSIVILLSPFSYYRLGSSSTDIEAGKIFGVLSGLACLGKGIIRKPVQSQADTCLLRGDVAK